MASKKIKKLSTGKKKFFKNPVLLVIAVVFVAVGVFLTFNTFAATSSGTGVKDPNCSGTNYSLYPTIGYGSAGPCVTRAQWDLIYLGYNIGPSGADGKFGQNTKNATIAFQQREGLAVDGVIGPNTWFSLKIAAHGN